MGLLQLLSRMDRLLPTFLTIIPSHQARLSHCWLWLTRQTSSCTPSSPQQACTLPKASSLRTSPSRTHPPDKGKLNSSWTRRCPRSGHLSAPSTFMVRTPTNVGTWTGFWSELSVDCHCRCLEMLRSQ